MPRASIVNLIVFIIAVLEISKNDHREVLYLIIKAKRKKEKEN